eukprot:jgi/Chlat1/2888/Chrsp2S04628
MASTNNSVAAGAPSSLSSSVAPQEQDKDLTSPGLLADAVTAASSPDKATCLEMAKTAITNVGKRIETNDWMGVTAQCTSTGKFLDGVDFKQLIHGRTALLNYHSSMITHLQAIGIIAKDKEPQGSQALKHCGQALFDLNQLKDKLNDDEQATYTVRRA